ncbi:head-tail adaptor protein [Donghicola sp. C2-DW-16]|uniref:Head-tail adaptor protein n=1 Tax=Donghicola mangrovi TaxID=2729614 RepID=A0ABX2PEF7_9RHOB|nr:head-tail adaptor protein [Donghicola mangrovi]NVO27768.1 head-tail adaptor protein [Donghicola mangrovi]
MSPRLTQEVTLEARSQVPDGAGGFQSGWAALGQLWAEMRAGPGRSASGPAVEVSLSRYQFVVRAAPVGDVQRPLAGQRFTMDGRVWNIEAVTELGTDGRYLTCHTTEEVTP